MLEELKDQPLFVLLFVQKAIKYVYTILVSPCTYYYTPGIQSMQWGYTVFVFSVCLCVSLSVNIYFVSKISQELLYLET